MTKDYPRIYVYKRIVQAKLFMDAHFSENINLHDIADEAYFSRFHFVRLFKTTYGFTPHQYLGRVRVDHAKLYLQEGMQASETCFAVGFDSVPSFTGLFKRYTGLTPAAWQKRYHERQQQIREVPLRFIPNCFAEKEGWVKK